MVSGSSKNDSPLMEISNLSAKKHSSSLNNSLKKSKLRACEYSSRVKKSLVGYFPKVIQVAAADCENANPNVKDLESVVVELREIERRLQRDLDLRNAEVERLANKVEMLELEKENFVREVSSLRMEISSAKSQIQVLKGAESSLKGFEIELEGLRSKNSQLEHQKSELECQLKKAESQLSCRQSDVEKSMQRPPRGSIPSSLGQLRCRLQSGTESTDNLSSNSCQETGRIFKQLSLEQKLNFPLSSYTDAENASSYSSSTSETGKSDGSDKFQGSVGLSTLSRRYFKARKSLKGSDNWFFPHEDSQSVNSSPRPSFSGSDDSNEDQKENVSDNLPNEACMPKNKRHRKNDEKQDRVIDRSVPRIPKPPPKASCDTAAYMTNDGEALGTRNDANLRKAPRIPRPPPKPSPSSTSPANKSFGLNSKSTPPPPPPPPPPTSFPLKISNGSVPRPPPPPPLSLSLKGSCSSTPPPPPPPPLLLHKQSTTTPMQRVPEVAEFYHSLMRRDQRKDSSGNVHIDSPDVANVRSNMIGEIENRSSHLMAIKTDVETQGDFVRSLIREVRTAAYSNIEDLVEFVKWLDEELSFLVDERAVLKHFDWPERKADALREASFAYSDLKKLVNEVSSYKDDHRQPCNVSLKKMTSLLERLERKVYAFLQMRDMTMSRYKEFQIPYDWMLDTGIISQIKLASVKLAKIYMRRVTTELEHIVSTENESMQETLVVQGVRFAFRVHQFAGGFDAESMSAFEQLKNLAQMCHRH